MYNSSHLCIQNDEGNRSLVGNNNQLKINRCNRLKLTITGNNNNIQIKDSRISLTITGNGNNINANKTDGDLSIIGNCNKCSLGSQGHLSIKNSIGNGNSIIKGSSDHSVRRPQMNMSMSVSNNQMYFNGLNIPYGASSFGFMGNFMGNGVAIGSNRPQPSHIISIQSSEQDQQSEQMSEDQQEVQQLMNDGLESHHLQKLPKTLSKGSSGTCTICMSGFQAKQYQTFLFCFHKFHTTCIHEWLRKKSQCPICQMNLREHL